jgi:hypothetical protein
MALPVCAADRCAAKDQGVTAQGMPLALYPAIGVQFVTRIDTCYRYASTPSDVLPPDVHVFVQAWGSARDPEELKRMKEAAGGGPDEVAVSDR